LKPSVRKGVQGGGAGRGAWAQGCLANRGVRMCERMCGATEASCLCANTTGMHMCARARIAHAFEPLFKAAGHHQVQRVGRPACEQHRTVAQRQQHERQVAAHAALRELRTRRQHHLRGVASGDAGAAWAWHSRVGPCRAARRGCAALPRATAARSCSNTPAALAHAPVPRAPGSRLLRPP
jgi:hypothetical protein